VLPCGTIEHLHELSELGFTVAHGSPARVGTLRPLTSWPSA
jgi:hypothetical protein